MDLTRFARWPRPRQVIVVAAALICGVCLISSILKILEGSYVRSIASLDIRRVAEPLSRLPPVKTFDVIFGSTSVLTFIAVAFLATSLNRANARGVGAAQSRRARLATAGTIVARDVATILAIVALAAAGNAYFFAIGSTEPRKLIWSLDTPFTIVKVVGINVLVYGVLQLASAWSRRPGWIGATIGALVIWIVPMNLMFRSPLSTFAWAVFRLNPLNYTYYSEPPSPQYVSSGPLVVINAAQAWLVAVTTVVCAMLLWSHATAYGDHDGQHARDARAPFASGAKSTWYLALLVACLGASAYVPLDALEKLNGSAQYGLGLQKLEPSDRPRVAWSEAQWIECGILGVTLVGAVAIRVGRRPRWR